MILYEGALGSILGTLILDTFFPNEMHAKWVLLAAMTVSYIYMKQRSFIPSFEKGIPSNPEIFVERSPLVS
jgi:hypothetical protein